MKNPESSLLPEGLVATKLIAPSPDARAISRDVLVERHLEEGGPVAVTAVVAPAGSGKSTFMAQLYARLHDIGIRTCWLSLDAEDNDPATFAIYLLCALNAIDRNFARDELTSLEANPSRDFDLFFDRLVGLISGLKTHAALFLDDFQNITDPRIVQFLDKLIAHLPRGLRLVIASRSALPLKLGRVRVAGSLLEIGQDDLNFSEEQAAQFLSRYHALQLSAEDLGALVESTEGWPTGVQLAALALQKHAGSAAELIKTFSGRDRNLTSYLVESVIRAQSDPVRLFLMRTSPLYRMCQHLCRVATGQANSDELLDYIGQANLFLIPLDRDGTWFRYHHLFAEFLQSEFRRTEPEEYRQVCHRAAKWCERNGLPTEAIRYALEAEQFEEAADMIARQAITASMNRGDHYTVLDWMRRLPPAFRERRPEILLSHAWSLAFSRNTDQAMEISDRVLRALSRQTNTWRLSEEERKLQILRARCVQAATKACSDDVDDCLSRARELREKVPEKEPFLIATLADCLAYSYFAKREFEQCREWALTAHEYGHKGDAAYLSAWGDFIHGLMDIELGMLKDAEQCGRRVHQDSNGLGLGQKSYVAGLFALLNMEIAIQRGDFDNAKKLSGAGRAFKEIFGPLQPQLVAIRGEARLLWHDRQLERARQTLQRGQDAALREKYPRLFFELAVEEASLQLMAGDPGAAADTIYRTGIRNRDALSGRFSDAPLLRGQQQLSRLLEARLHNAQGEHLEAFRILTSMQQSRAGLGRGSHMLVASTNRAVAFWGLGKRKEAARELDYALDAAAPAFHVYPILTAGRDLIPILEFIADRRATATTDSIRPKIQLQNWIESYLLGNARPIVEAAQPPPAEPEPHGQALESLTAREVELLRLLQAGLSNRQLANTLLVSESTVKWHLHNVYSKLGVRSRGEAMARAAQLAI